MENLKILFYKNLFWWVDVSGTLHIEHLKYLDLTSNYKNLENVALTRETKKFSYDKSDSYETIKLSMTNASFSDFTDNEINNDHIASNERGSDDMETEESVEIFTTDLKHCIENANDNDNGLLLLACDSENNCMNASVQLADKEFENGYLALSTILNSYCTYHNISYSGKINGDVVAYETLSKIKQGKEFSVKGILAKSPGNGYRSIVTKIGTGLIKSYTFNLSKQTSSDIVLLYGYDEKEEENDNNIVLVISRTEDPYGEIWYNFDNYETQIMGWYWNISAVSGTGKTRTFALLTSDSSTQQFYYTINLEIKDNDTTSLVTLELYADGNLAKRIVAGDLVVDGYWSSGRDGNFTVNGSSDIEFKLITSVNANITANFAANTHYGADLKYRNIDDIEIKIEKA
jgi:hypothetical protein